MPDSENITVAKIAATPSDSSWAQAYNAGRLFAVISLTREKDDEKEELNVLGKEIIETLEQEFFGLEVKDLSSIRTAFETAIKKIPENLESSFVVSSLVKNIVYVFYFGQVRVSIKRDGEFGVLVDSKVDKEKGAVSGILKDNDVLVLQSSQFRELIPSNVLLASIDSQPPSEIAETVAPIIHREEKGGASAVILKYKALAQKHEEEAADVLEIQAEEPEIERPKKESFNFSGIIATLESFIKIPKLGKVNHARKLILTIAVVVAILLASVIFISIKKQDEARVNALFESVYKKAESKYNEGAGLSSLNKNLARDSFGEAYKILNDNKNKFPKDSKEEKQVLELLSRTQKALGETSGVTATAAKEEDEGRSEVLSIATETNSNYVAQDDKNIYFVKDGVVSRDKGNDKEKTIIESSDLPSSIGGLSVYNGNVYILDKDENQIYKFAGADYTKSNYFSSSKPDLSSAKAIAIDGSIWILTRATVAKYTKGVSDNLTISGLDKPFLSPTRISTNADTDNVYILDNGNSRIVVLKKNGEYDAQYQAGVLKAAKNFEVSEKDKTVYILSGGKIYSIKLQ